MPQFCGCVRNKSSESIKFQSSNRPWWPWKKHRPLNDTRPVSSGTQIGESFDITEGDITEIFKNPPIARGESEDQESQTGNLASDQAVAVTKSVHAPVIFELSPPKEGPLKEVTQRNRSLDIEIGHNFQPHKEMEAPSLTYPNMFNLKSNRVSTKLHSKQNGSCIRKGSLIVRSNRPLPAGMAFGDGRSSVKNKPPSQTSLVRNDSRVGIERFLDETTIVTPYAQILAGLRSVQKKIVWLTKNAYRPVQEKRLSNPETIESTPSCSNEDFESLASGTVKELEWCLQQLENIQTKRPVSDMASTKFKRLLSQKLGSFNSTDKDRNQISKYISKTFMDEYSELDDDEEDTVLRDTAENQSKGHSKKAVTPQHVTRFSFGSSSAGDGLLSAGYSDQSSVKVRMISLPDNTDILPILEASATIPYHGCATKHDKELKEVLEASLDAWGINMFNVDTLSGQHALTVIGYRIFVNRGLFSTFNIDPATFVNYLLRLEASYLATSPYHNHVHAADVLQSVHVLLQAETLECVFSDLEILSSLFASAIHDANHPGLTNQFLINTGHRLALLYNDASVLENHHLSVAFKLLTEPGCDIFANLAPKQRQTLRRLVIELVLATDMSKHMNLLAELRTMVETKELTGSGFLNLDDHNDRSLVLQCMIHCADLSNPAKPFPLYKQWTYRVMEEFFRQGDKEKELGIEVSAMCDRESVVVDKTQIGFIDFVVHPLYETWCDLVHPAAERILETLDTNRDIIHNESPFKEFEI